MTEKRRSTVYRIAFIYSGAFALAVALLGVLVYIAAERALRGQQDLALSEATASLERSYRTQGYDGLIDAIGERGRTNGVVTFGYALFDATGKKVAGSFELDLPPPGYSNVVFRDPVEGPDHARALTTRLDRNLSLVVGVDSQVLERLDRLILALFAAVFVLILAIGAGGALALGGYLRRRLDRISGTAQAIVAGDMRRRVPVSPRGDEFDQIARLLDNLRQVSADVAHDLRTPLARQRAGLEAALALDDPTAQRAAIAKAVEQADASLALFGGILRIVEVDAGDVRQGFVAVDLSALAEDLVDSYAPAVADKGRTLACDIAPGIVVPGDRELIAQAAINLLDNAQAHTPPGTAIRLTLRAEPGLARLEVADDGPGVPAADRARIVERFVRLDRSRAARGHGLGLNLVDAIARAHGGTLAIEDAAPGLSAVLRLPRR